MQHIATDVVQANRDPVQRCQVGNELGVRYVLEGSVRRSTSRIRITAQLIEIAQNPDSALKEAAVGFVADVGVLQRLPLIVGQGMARQMAFTAGRIDAAQDRRAFATDDVLRHFREESGFQTVTITPSVEPTLGGCEAEAPLRTSGCR